jgi:hypothetical protein
MMMTAEVLEMNFRANINVCYFTDVRSNNLNGSPPFNESFLMVLGKFWKPDGLILTVLAIFEP